VDVAAACKEADIKAFPTWVINGQVTEGELDLEQVAAALEAPPAAATAAEVGVTGELAALAVGSGAAAVP
jgi:alkyl hydroperoxide reductase subunit AhpF